MMHVIVIKFGSFQGTPQTITPAMAEQRVYGAGNQCNSIILYESGWIKYITIGFQTKH